MRNIQTVTEYFYTVYTLAAIILSGYVLWMVSAARQAKARADATKR